jgi:hypothetical protein
LFTQTTDIKKKKYADLEENDVEKFDQQDGRWSPHEINYHPIKACSLPTKIVVVQGKNKNRRMMVYNNEKQIQVCHLQQNNLAELINRHTQI